VFLHSTIGWWGRYILALTAEFIIYTVMDFIEPATHLAIIRRYRVFFIIGGKTGTAEFTWENIRKKRPETDM
jgi:hypothetical protein